MGGRSGAAGTARGHGHRRGRRGRARRLAGRREPFIAGVEITAVDRREAFPSTHIVALFRADTHPGIVFGRRWDLYDELGNPRSLRYADVHLMGDIEAAGHGLPPADACGPDADGITWF